MINLVTQLYETSIIKAKGRVISTFIYALVSYHHIICQTVINIRH